MRRSHLMFAFRLVAACCVGLLVGTDLQGQLVPTAELRIVDRSALPEGSSEPLLESAPPVIGIASLPGDNYVRAVRQCGGIPIVLPNTDGSSDTIEAYLELLDGLLMPGGPDIPPSEWGEAVHPTTKVLDTARYRFEKAMITAWIERTDKPLLGTCLGSQWVNVAHGGSLIQDIPSEFGGHFKGQSHPVKLASDSRLARIYGKTEFVVNSLHHQAVRDVGDGLRVVARSTDGIIEGTETTDPDRFLIGVQWHPEKLMPEDKLQEKLIRAFVEAASESESDNEPSESQRPAEVGASASKVR